MSERLVDVVTEMAQWSRVAERNGELHARLASALALFEDESGALREALRDGLTVFGDTQWADTYRHLWGDDA